MNLNNNELIFFGGLSFSKFFFNVINVLICKTVLKF